MSRKPIQWALISLSLIGMVVFAACGSTKPLTATEILAKARSAKLKSANFVLDAKISIAGSDVTATGTGAMTASPARVSLTLKANNVTVHEVQDGTSLYQQIEPETTWTKTTVTDPDQQINPTGYDIQNPTLVGKETVNGVETYHLKGTDKNKNPSEVWVKTDNFYPVKTTIVTTGDSPLNGTLTFSDWDTNITITVPSPDQVSG